MRLINLHPNRGGTLALGVLPFIILLVAYLLGSNARLAENADDKLLPAPSTLVATLHSYAMEEDQRSGAVLWWLDTFASLRRIGIALGISAAIGLSVGLAIGAVPVVRALFAPFVTVLSMIPPLAVVHRHGTR
jgi:NitT/TauT family transport system permease protein